MNAKCELSHTAAVHLARICENSDPASPQGNKNVEPTGRRPAGDMAPTKFQIHLYSAARTVRQQKASFALPWRMHVKGIAWESFAIVLNSRDASSKTIGGLIRPPMVFA